MNYDALTPDELERLAYIGDAQAKLKLGETHEMVPLWEAEKQAADAQEEGEQSGYTNACRDIFSRFAESILSASNGNRDDDVCEGLKQLMAFVEEYS